MEKKDRLAKAIAYLKMHGLADSQVDAARKMKAAESTMSSAMSGNEKYLNNKFLKRFNEAFGNIFNLEWLIDGVGSMCCAPQSDINTLFNSQGDNSTNQQIVGASNEALIKENEMLKQLLEEKERMIQLLLKK